MRIRLELLPADNWVRFLRQRDLEQVLALTSGQLRGPVLEVGCGDGYATCVLRTRFDRVVAIDLRPGPSIDGVVRATVEKLPFRDGCFGFVYSSNVLEHVEDLSACLRELRRVARDDAEFVHTMPTTAWKALSLALYPFHLALHLAVPRLLRCVRAIWPGTGRTHGPPSAVPRGGARESGRPGFTRLFLPAVHGAASSHLEEFKRLRVESWLRHFADAGFDVQQTVPLFLHSPYRLLPFRGLLLRELISRVGLCSVRAYRMRKACRRAVSD